MNTKVFVYAVPHEDNHQDKVLVIKEPDKNVLTLPQGDVEDTKYPEWEACALLKRQTGYNIFPDHRMSGFVLGEPDFFRFPILKGKIKVGTMQVLCYQIEVNERHKPQGDSVWLPWYLLRHDGRVSALSRFIMALLYSGISGWELNLDEAGVWRITCMSISNDRTSDKFDTISQIISGEIQMEMSDTFFNITKKSSNNFMMKYEAKKKKPKEEQPPQKPRKRSWLWWLGL